MFSSVCLALVNSALKLTPLSSPMTSMNLPMYSEKYIFSALGVGQQIVGWLQCLYPHWAFSHTSASSVFSSQPCKKSIVIAALSS